MSQFTQEQLDAAVAKAVEDATGGLKANRDEALKESKAAKAKLAAYDGVDPAEFKRLKDAADQAERASLEGKGKWDTLEQQLKERHAQEIEGERKKGTKASKALERRLVSDELRRALSKAEAIEGMTDLLVLEGSRFVNVKETDDDFESVVTDGKGNPLVADGQGKPMTVDLFVEQTLKTKYPHAFKGTGSSGGGASKSGASGTPGVVSDGASFMKNLGAVAKGDVVVRT